MSEDTAVEGGKTKEGKHRRRSSLSEAIHGQAHASSPVCICTLPSLLAVQALSKTQESPLQVYGWHAMNHTLAIRTLLIV